MHSLYLEDMTWTEARDAFQSIDTVILPVGMCEQHGYHLPLGSDSFVADYLARRVGELSEVIVAPLMPYGCAPTHSEYPGTLSLSRTAFESTVQDICDALVSHGAKRIVFMNGHGGNHTVLHDIGVRLRRREILCAIFEWWKISGLVHPQGTITGHAESIETLVTMAIWPGKVDVKAARCAPVGRSWTQGITIETHKQSRFRGAPVDIPLLTKDFTPSGSWGQHPSELDPELGPEIVEALVEFIAAFVREFKTAQVPS